jgi:YVTN family beta-propeller protein
LGLPAAVLVLAGVAYFLVSRPAAPELEIGQAVPVGREPIGLARSTDGSRLFVVNAADGTLSAIVLTGASSGRVSGTFKVASERLNSVAVAPDGTSVFVTEVEKGRVYKLAYQNNGDEARDTAKIVGHAETGEFPQGVIASSDGKTIFTADTGSNTVSLIDAETLERKQSIGVGERPFSLEFGPDQKIYVTTNVHTVEVIDPVAGKALEPFDLGELARLQGLAVSSEGQIFVADGLTDLVQEVDKSGKARLDPGDIPQNEEFSPTDVALSPDGSRLYVVGRSGYVGVIDPKARRLVQTLKPGGDLRQVVVGADGRVYATDFGGNRVVVLRPAAR